MMEYGADINICLGTPLYTVEFYEGGTDLVYVGKANNREIVGKIGHNPNTAEVKYDEDHTYVELDGNLWIIKDEYFVR